VQRAADLIFRCSRPQAPHKGAGRNQKASLILSRWEHVHGLRELLVQPEGDVWWSKNAQSLEVIFDVSPKSPSMDILRTYTKRKGIRIFQCFTHPSFK
jgi:hypothetical protein